MIINIIKDSKCYGKNIKFIYENSTHLLYKINWNLYLINKEKLFKINKKKNVILKYLTNNSNKINYSENISLNKYLNDIQLDLFFPEVLKKTCYLISYKEQNLERFLNLIFTLLECKKHFLNYLDIYVIEQDTNIKLTYDKLNEFEIKDIKLLFDKHDDFFNRGKALNYGLNFIKDKGYENIIIGDADIPLERNICYLLPLLKNYYFINPYSSIYNTNNSEKKDVIKNKKINQKINDNIKNHYTFSGGVLLANYEKFKEINFFYEFDCYGNEDRILDVYLDTNNIPIYNDNFIYLHLYHNKSFSTKIEKNKIIKNTLFLRNYFGCTTGTLGKINFLKPISNHFNCNHKKNNEIYEKKLFFK